MWLQFYFILFYFIFFENQMWLQLVWLLWSAFFSYLFEICGKKLFVFSDSVTNFHQQTLEFYDLSMEYVISST